MRKAMGSGVSKDEANTHQRVMNAQIEANLRTAKQEAKDTLKMLLLGAGESGKSTILKQMRILHCNGFQEEEYLVQKRIIYSSVLHSMLAILDAMAAMKIDLHDKRHAESAKTVRSLDLEIDRERLDGTLLHALKRLWKDEGVQKCFERRDEYNLNDSSQFFFENLDRIADKDYKPNEHDMLLANVRTTGIVEVVFSLKGRKFRVFDVGGQRSERKKWIHCFDDVNAVIFVASLSEYDQKLTEDRSVNRMLESLMLFESVCNSPWFAKTAMILFLNKTDLMKEKLKRNISLKIAFPDYAGSTDFDEAYEFVKAKFSAQNKNKARDIYVNQTCATDTTQMKFVLSATIDITITANLKKAGLVT